MRWKIIAVNSLIVLLVGLLSYALLRASLGDLATNQAQLQGAAERSLAAANSKLELDALRTERWLDAKTNYQSTRDVFKTGTVKARQEAATTAANMLRADAVASPVFAGMAPTLVAVVDASGVVLGRDSSNLMRGEDVGEMHPSIKASIAQGVTSSDVWADAKTSELMVVSAAPVRDDDRSVLGLLIVGTPLNDERLQKTSELTSGRALILGIPSGDKLDIKAKSGRVAANVLAAVAQSPLKDEALATVGSGHGALLTGGPPEFIFTAAPLSGYGDGKRAVLISAAPASLIESVGALLWPLFAVTALGILLVFAGGFLIGNYMSRPIEQLEEGLLAILNGRTDLRFEIEHAELGCRKRLHGRAVGRRKVGSGSDLRPSRGRASRRTGGGLLQAAFPGLHQCQAIGR
jgi:hypothetical protein